MNQRMVEELAREHLAALQGATAEAPRARAAKARAARLNSGPADIGAATAARASLRERAGWTLISLGLRLAARSQPGTVARPHPAGS